MTPIKIRDIIALLSEHSVHNIHLHIPHLYNLKTLISKSLSACLPQHPSQHFSSTNIFFHLQYFSGWWQHSILSVNWPIFVPRLDLTVWVLGVIKVNNAKQRAYCCCTKSCLEFLQTWHETRYLSFIHQKQKSGFKIIRIVRGANFRSNDLLL